MCQGKQAAFQGESKGFCHQGRERSPSCRENSKPWENYNISASQLFLTIPSCTRCPGSLWFSAEQFKQRKTTPETEAEGGRIAKAVVSLLWGDAKIKLMPSLPSGVVLLKYSF